MAPPFSFALFSIKVLFSIVAFEISSILMAPPLIFPQPWKVQLDILKKFAGSLFIILSEIIIAPPPLVELPVKFLKSELLIFIMLDSRILIELMLWVPLLLDVTSNTVSLIKRNRIYSKSIKFEGLWEVKRTLPKIYTLSNGSKANIASPKDLIA